MSPILTFFIHISWKMAENGLAQGCWIGSMQHIFPLVLQLLWITPIKVVSRKKNASLGHIQRLCGL